MQPASRPAVSSGSRKLPGRPRCLVGVPCGLAPIGRLHRPSELAFPALGGALRCPSDADFSTTVLPRSRDGVCAGRWSVSGPVRRGVLPERRLADSAGLVRRRPVSAGQVPRAGAQRSKSLRLRLANRPGLNPRVPPRGLSAVAGRPLRKGRSHAPLAEDKDEPLMPEPGYHTVRSYVRRNPGTAAKKTSPWITGAVVVAALWAWGHLGGTSQGATHAHTPAPTVSKPVTVAHR